MNENLKRILSQKAKIHIERYLKKYKKVEYEHWWLLRDILKNHIENYKLCENFNEIEIDKSLENLIEYLKKTYSNKNQISKEISKYNKEYYNKRKKGNEMTNLEKALKTAAIKREKSFNLVNDAYAKLIKLNKKPTCQNIEIMINSQVKKSMIANYLKEIKKGEK